MTAIYLRSLHQRGFSKGVPIILLAPCSIATGENAGLSPVDVLLLERAGTISLADDQRDSIHIFTTVFKHNADIGDRGSNVFTRPPLRSTDDLQTPVSVAHHQRSSFASWKTASNTYRDISATTKFQVVISATLDEFLGRRTYHGDARITSYLCDASSTNRVSFPRKAATEVEDTYKQYYTFPHGSISDLGYIYQQANR
jgi:hypothetical protein